MSSDEAAKPIRVLIADDDEMNRQTLAEIIERAPTGNGVLLVDSTFIGEDPAGGGTDLDASLVEDLSGPIADSGFSAQPNQGFHVTVTVQAEGSIGATTKHKTYWVDNCGGGEGGGEGGEGLSG